MRLTVLLAGALLCVVCSPSFACDVMRPCYGNGRPIYSEVTGQAAKLAQYRPAHAAHRKGHRRTYPAAIRIQRHLIASPGLRRVLADGAGRVLPPSQRGRVVGGRPAGCPHAFCGCGASLHIFGRIIPALNLARNWLRFPRAEPAAGMVAVRRHHVFVLVRHISGKVWLAHDSNSGRHRTRVHPRSIVGYVIVDPRAGA